MQEKESQSVIGYIKSNLHLTNEQIASDLKVSPELITKLRNYAKLSISKNKS